MRFSIAKASSVGCISLCLSLTLGCARFFPKPPDLGEIYSRAASHHEADRRPIIVIPGILGSTLVDEKSGQTVWGAFAGGYARPDRPEGARAVALPLDPEKGDAVVPIGVLEKLKVRFLGLPISLKAYVNIINVLGAGGYADEALGLAGSVDYGDDHYTCFQFSYDFRLDNSENARRLHEFILEKREYVREEHERRYGPQGDAEIKFDIVAHSMGGLLTRYFLRYGGEPLGDEGPLPELTWAGAEYVERAILVGTPNAGSLEALLNLVDGEKFGPTVPRYSAAILGSFPSVYQLLPRSRHGALRDSSNGEPLGDIFDPSLWKELGWGLSSPGQEEHLSWLLPEVDDPAERYRLAERYLSWALVRAERFTRALDLPASPPEGTELFLVAGDSVPTAHRANVDRRTGEVTIAHHAPGDGRVLRTSALLDEREGRATWSPRLDSPIDWRYNLFLHDNHLGVTSNPVFSDNVLFWLLEEPR